MGCPNCGKGWFNTLCRACAGRKPAGTVTDALITAHNIARAVSVFNWLEPIRAGLETVAHDPPIGLNTWTFYFKHDQVLKLGWSLSDIRALLDEHGIQTYGAIVQTWNDAHFGVPIGQARKAEKILKKHEVPIKEISQGAP